MHGIQLAKNYISGNHFFNELCIFIVMKKLLFLSGVLLSLSIANAQKIDVKSLDALMDSLDKRDKFMGSVALSINDTIVYRRAIGFADVENNIKNTVDTKFRIGSISKTFTAAMIMHSVMDGKLGLNSPISMYFPTIPNGDKISISHMLKHRSGIHSVTDDEDYMDWHSKPIDRKKMIEKISSHPVEFQPDSESRYSNSNYILLSYLLEDLYSKPYAELLQEKIISKIDLQNTKVGTAINTAAGESKSYSKNGKKWELEQETDMSVPMGAGNIISTPSELIFFINALIQKKIIVARGISEMTGIRGKYGSGLFEIPFYDKVGIGHTGGIDGFSSVLGSFPMDKISFAITCNGQDFPVNEISIALLNAAYGKKVTIPSFNELKLDSKILDKYVGVYSDESFPLKIYITQQDGQLFAQATGQSAFPLSADNEKEFQFKTAGIKMQFDANKKILKFSQAGNNFTLNRE